MEEKYNHEYGANQIQVLEGLEAVRKRPGMYIGSVSARGLHHLVYEIVDNSVDESLAGYCTKIQVKIEPGIVISVEDNGRGIPVDIHAKTHISAAETVYTVLHAGGKFGGDSGYKVSGGLHGVGASVVNALSEWTEVTIQRDGGIYQMKFERGKTVEPLRRIGDSDKTGTKVRFLADSQIFETTEYTYEVLQNRLREMAFLTKGLYISLEDLRGEEPKKVYISDITEFDRMFNTNQGNVTPETITRYNELKQKQNNVFYSSRMGGNITVLVEEGAYNFGRKYVLEFATQEKLNQIRGNFEMNFHSDYAGMMFDKE